MTTHDKQRAQIFNLVSSSHKFQSVLWDNNRLLNKAKSYLIHLADEMAMRNKINAAVKTGRHLELIFIGVL